MKSSCKNRLTPQFNAFAATVSKVNSVQTLGLRVMDHFNNRNGTTGDELTLCVYVLVFFLRFGCEQIFLPWITIVYNSTEVPFNIWERTLFVLVYLGIILNLAILFWYNCDKVNFGFLLTIELTWHMNMIFGITLTKTQAICGVIDYSSFALQTVSCYIKCWCFG